MRPDENGHENGAAQLASQTDPDSDTVAQYTDSAVAVVGVACRFAGADSLEQLWQLLETGASHCVDLPKDRFPELRSRYRNCETNFRASLMSDVDSFDHKFFNVSSREASFRDPQQRLALEVTYQALESAGYFARDITEEGLDVGCYFAIAMNEYRENVITHAPSAFSLTGSIRPFVAGQVSHHFGFTGPSIIIDAACAASGAAVNIACRAVASGECKSAIAGAANIFSSPATFHDLAAGHFTSPSGQSRPFDAAADGYGRGEGVAAIVLKRLSDALREGDVIRGIIPATATNQCANETPITVPHGPTQSSLYRKTLQLAHLEASQIGYVEAHGTGTRIGDPIETESIRAVFGDESREPDSRTYIGSLKSNIGHTEATSGLSGLIKVMLMIEKGVIPKQALFSGLNPEIAPLEPSGLEINMENRPWTSSYRAGCVNNYGASGSNTVMIVTQAPARIDQEMMLRAGVYPVTITAFSQTSLNSYCTALLDFIDHTSASDDLARDVSFHLSRRRNPELPFSITASISGPKELRNFLTTAQSQAAHKPKYSTRPAILFFGGQDGKTVCVSRELYDSCLIFRKHLDDCDASLQVLGHGGVLATLFEPNRTDGSVLAHSKLFSVQYASAKAWMDCGLQPSRLIGHSFGQLTALCVSGALSLRDALHLVTSRARLIDETWGSDPGAMIAIDATQDEVSELLEQHTDLGLEIACHNGAHSFVVAGTTTSVDSLEALMAGATKLRRYKRLQISNAFHSRLAEPLIGPLHEVVRKLNLQEPKIPLETCSEHSTWQSMDPLLIASQSRDAVHFHQAVQRIANQLGPCVWIEAGSGANVSLLRRALEPQTSSHVIKSLKMDSSCTLKHLADMTADLWMSGLKVQFWPFHQGQQHQYGILNLPPYQFDKTRHWIDWQDSNIQPITEASPFASPESLVRLSRENKDGYEFQLNTTSETWQKGCAENRVLDVPVCPLSLVLDILSQAIEKVLKASVQNVVVHRIQCMEFLVPIPAETDDPLCLEIGRLDSSQSLTFLFRKASDRRFTYASGSITTSPGISESDFTRFGRLVDSTKIKELENDVAADCIRGRAVYRASAELFHIPRSDQVIRSVSVKGNEAAARLTSSGESPSVILERLLQIPLICLNAMYERPDDQVYINTAVGDAQLQEPLDCTADGEALSSVYVKFFDISGPETTCDLYMFDSRRGRLSAVVLDVGFVLLPIESLRHAITDNWSNSLQQATDCEQYTTKTPVTREDNILTSQVPEQITCEEPPHSNGQPELVPALFGLLVRIAEVNADGLHESTMIADLGVDSLMWFEVADEINKFFAVNIDVADFMAAEDMGDLCQLVASQSAGFSYSVDTDPSSSSSLTARSGTTATSSNIEVSKPREGSKAAANLDAAFDAFDAIREEFDILAKDAGCDKFWSEVHPAQTRLIEAYMIEALAKLSCDLASLKMGERLPPIPHIPGRDRLLERLMPVLREANLITQAGKYWIRTNKPMPSRPSSTELFHQIQARFPKWAPEHELLHIAGSNLAGHFDGTQNPLKVLFGTPEKRQLMADQYRIAPIQSTLSRQLASFLSKFLALRPRDTQSKLRVLEVGAGTCGTTIYALDAFVQAGLIPAEYTFTDISPSFISAAKSKLKTYKFVEYRTLDISEEPPAELPGTYDVVLATNVIHATRDACKSAGNVRALLREGGFFAMVEYTRVYAAVDVIFGQLDGWWLFDDGRTHATMDEVGWDKTLRRAGFGRVEWTGSHTRESEIARVFLAC